MTPPKDFEKTSSQDSKTPSADKAKAHLVAIEKPEAEKKAREPLSKRSENKLDRLLVARGAREYAEQVLGIGLRPLVMCGLPLRNPGPPYLHKRRCGEFVLEIVGHPEHGVPYGHDRIIPIWIASAFVHLGCPEDNTIHFPYARDILRAFGLSPDGKNYQRLRAGFQRFSSAHFTLRRERKNPRGTHSLYIKNLPLLDDYRAGQGPLRGRSGSDRPARLRPGATL